MHNHEVVCTGGTGAPRDVLHELQAVLGIELSLDRRAHVSCSDLPVVWFSPLIAHSNCPTGFAGFCFSPLWVNWIVEADKKLHHLTVLMGIKSTYSEGLGKGKKQTKGSNFM